MKKQRGKGGVVPRYGWREFEQLLKCVTCHECGTYVFQDRNRIAVTGIEMFQILFSAVKQALEQKPQQQTHNHV